MSDIRKQINTQKKFMMKNKEKLDFFLIYDPILKTDQISLW